ncbi:hypothetical protein EIN_366820 [Entamoeba invadens IP1]|uniref:Uncharacterized protein n=1 Tax=Entamoeba invadens IP1 TaxID=370355 RepID=L7FLF2_ENTIV|nr:hypothetical protein EIN_366820 [Entamoeba invadens IP1]ELP88620.1 hypothetical protein EIN_366820 [Entamoeba invadens IP1]|eukprot:XP_004255391.1 hypothetical protein EIN_366820 [Entamoeba invadens IP1]
MIETVLCYKNKFNDLLGTRSKQKNDCCKRRGIRRYFFSFFVQFYHQIDCIYSLLNVENDWSNCLNFIYVIVCVIDKSCNNIVNKAAVTNNGCISQISKCKEINNSKCSKCSFWYSPIKYGTLCESRAVWSVIIVAFFVCSYCFDSIIVSLVVVTKNIFNKLHTHKIVKTTTLFAMNISNINFVSFQSGVCVSSTVIDLNSDTEQIEVNKETSQVLCVGNTNKNSTKKQFTISSNITKFTIRVDPEVVTLKYDFACEFSVFVTPLCSCNIDNNIQLISKNLK